MRDLFVAIHTNFAWGSLCKGLINKCNRTIGMIKRSEIYLHRGGDLLQL